VYIYIYIYIYIFTYTIYIRTCNSCCKNHTSASSEESFFRVLLYTYICIYIHTHIYIFICVYIYHICIHTCDSCCKCDHNSASLEGSFLRFSLWKTPMSLALSLVCSDLRNSFSETVSNQREKNCVRLPPCNEKGCLCSGECRIKKVKYMRM